MLRLQYALLICVTVLILSDRPAFCLSDEQVKRRNGLFDEVFDGKTRLDAGLVKQVLALPAGERLWVDSDDDGRADEVWFIDTDKRHVIAEHHPILVRAIDEDGDLREGLPPDLDSDLYIADWKADGTVDVVLDYTDTDGDQDVDEMAFYFYRPRDPYFGEDTLCAWWAKDIGDDNLLWHDVGYGYSQTHCQWRCHFGGDEMFVHFTLRRDPLRWTPTWENPFIFYDHDGDDCSEEVVRFSGIGDRVENIRWSMDADNDSSAENPHDYDFSLTAWARGCRWQSIGDRTRAELQFSPSQSERTALRGIPTEGFLAPDAARRWGREAAWERILLTWDENDRNHDGRPGGDPHERWEGVIAQGNDRFPQVGGPGCGALNKRYEICIEPGSRLGLYWSRIDRRIHLRGGSDGWIDVDRDLDGEKDAVFKWRDTDGDGFFDRWEIDADADGRVDKVVAEKNAAGWATPVPMDYGEVRRFLEARGAERSAKSKIQYGVPLHRPSERAAGVAAADEWLPANIAWESDRVAYRSHWGQFDFFGKKRPMLIYPTIKPDQYVTEQEWGMDVLPVGETPGIGGMTLYVDDKRYPIRSPHGEGAVKFEKRVITKGPERATVEVVASNVGPPPHPYTVRFRPHALSKRADSPIDFLITGGPPEDGGTTRSLQLGVALRTFEQEEIFLDSAAGIFGSWAYPAPEIGWIGMGLIFDPERFARLDDRPDEHIVVLDVERGREARHWIVGDWQRGRRFDRCPSVENWRRELRSLSLALRNTPAATDASAP